MNYKEYNNINLFLDGLDSLNIKLTSHQIQQFVDFYELLIEWNKVMNLTTITEFSDVIYKHFLDSLSMVKLIIPEDENIIDVGTGAGFPAIPLKIAFPGVKIVLLDSLNKRMKFLDEVIDRLSLKEIRTLHGRAEDYGKDILYREKFDISVSRAVANLSTLTEYCIPFVKIGGSFISYKAGKIDDELREAENAIKVLGGQVYGIDTYTITDTAIDRTLLQIMKISETKDNYPRTAGKPTKQPL